MSFCRLIYFNIFIGILIVILIYFQVYLHTVMVVTVDIRLAWKGVKRVLGRVRMLPALKAFVITMNMVGSDEAPNYFFSISAKAHK